MLQDFDIASLDVLHDLLPESTCPNCNAIFSRIEDRVEIEERPATPADLRRIARQAEMPIEQLGHIATIHDISCGICHSDLPAGPQLAYPFADDDYLQRVYALGRALTAFPPFAPYGSIDITRVPSYDASVMPESDGNWHPVNINLDPYDALIGVFEQATWRIHFTTWTIHENILVELQQLAAKKNIIVRGVVGVEPTTGRGKLKPEISDNFSVLIADDRKTKHLFTHTKLVILDGLAAIKGSANLQPRAYRGIADNPPGDVVEAVTSMRQAQLLNNRIFAPVWAALRRNQHKEN